MSAPFHADLAEAPVGGAVIWRTAEDGIRLRLGVWSVSSARGTILLLPGRTEYIEKYGRVISELTAGGYAVATIDWRGQGYSDRHASDPVLGHVGAFSDYQLDIAELVAAASEAELPRPWFMLAHSAGGSIGLRALIEGIVVERAVFSAPMWRILIPKRKLLIAMMAPTLARATGKSLDYLPGSRANTYATKTGFVENALTSDREYFDYLSRQASAVPEFALGGPSIHWFGEAQAECRRLLRAARPTLPIHTFLGTREEVVDPSAVWAMHANWPSAKLTVIEDGRHELMMDVSAVRRQFFDGALAFLEA